MTSTAGSLGGATPIEPQQGSLQLSAARTYDPKWQKVFDAAAIKAGDVPQGTAPKPSFWTLLSVPGFFFGPFYYFYLRMWRRGVLLLALFPMMWVVEELVGSTNWEKLFIAVTCGVLAKRDYYRFCVKGEAVWSPLRWSKNIWTDAALAVGVFIACLAVLTTMAYDRRVSGSGSASNRTSISQSSSTNGEAPAGTITVQKKLHFSNIDYRQSGYDIVITSKVDYVHVYGVTVNRGSCQATPVGNSSLRFGQTMESIAFCNPIEAVVDTNAGKVSVSWSR